MPCVEVLKIQLKIRFKYLPLNKHKSKAQSDRHTNIDINRTNTIIKKKYQEYSGIRNLLNNCNIPKSIIGFTCYGRTEYGLIDVWTD